MGQGLIYINDTAYQRRALSQVNCSLVHMHMNHWLLSWIPCQNHQSCSQTLRWLLKRGSWVFGISGILEWYIFWQFLTMDIQWTSIRHEESAVSEMNWFPAWQVIGLLPLTTSKCCSSKREVAWIVRSLAVLALGWTVWKTPVFLLSKMGLLVTQISGCELPRPLPQERVAHAYLTSKKQLCQRSAYELRWLI